MDALRKAEQAKRTGRSVEPVAGTAADASLRPATPAESPVTLPELPPSLDVLDAEFAPAPVIATTVRDEKPSPAPTAKAGESEQRNMARAVFAAKQPSSVNRTPAVIGGGALLMALAGIGAYFWWQLKPLPQAPVSFAPPPAQPAPFAGLAPPPAKADAVEAPPPQAMPLPAPPSAARPVAPVLRSPAVEPAPANPIRISSRPLATNPALDEAYGAFQRGDLESARSAYERALAADPRNSDALHGAAAVALRQGHANEAEAYYERLVDANPTDAAAQSALLGLRSPADPAIAESRLKTLLVGQPESPALHFALGNLYGRQSRWSEAQQAYFRALTGDGDNPDYLFNLAVSLDQMHQPRLAAQYYRQAIAAAATRPAAFDIERATTRLNELPH